ncbi:hypothetical protein Cfla_0120 [Cellulomonas flavigena DSM 20109]|uniref:Uncharacterized protein n=1 Tax=Cellulomonas flavigena (strain ATCC 482 / DSM 20109 / BCRC 11376 / JCM 18109 / NBRC 3775 / NCIMB 8073 / NRS 134) TaxID=446466 RepID=D5UFT1_CELFN|nr:hypothetical protein Cfla_0120 [Cellulomonas flavigena DSM 20109]
MLDELWPPPFPGPHQPRDAHAAHWGNDVRRRFGGTSAGAVSDDDLWADLLRHEHAERRRATDDAWTADAADGHPHDVPEVRGTGSRPDRGARRGLPASWVPQEEWIPDPVPPPEQRWTPEQDWLTAFADRPAGVLLLDPPAPRRWGRWVGLALAVVLPLAAVVALVVVLR